MATANDRGGASTATPPEPPRGLLWLAAEVLAGAQPEGLQAFAAVFAALLAAFYAFRAALHHGAKWAAEEHQANLWLRLLLVVFPHPQHFKGGASAALAERSLSFSHKRSVFLAQDLRAISPRTRGVRLPGLVDVFGVYPLSNAAVLLLAAVLWTQELDPRLQENVRAVLVSVLLLRGLMPLAAESQSIIQAVMEQTHVEDPMHAGWQHLSTLVTASAWAFGLGAVLSRFGYDTSHWLTGLGIGGVVLGIAAQSTLQNFFAALSIFVDRPFGLHDFVRVHTGSEVFVGCVQSIGFRTSCLRLQDSGEILHIPNAALAAAKIENAREMRERSVLFKLRVEHETGAAVLRQIPDIVRGAVASCEQARPDFCCLMDITDIGHEFHVRYHVTTNDPAAYKRAQHDINVQIAAEFQARSIRFAKRASGAGHPPAA